MTGDTLLLNKDFRPLSVFPLSVINWKTAIKLIFLERINVLHYHEDWNVHSPSMSMSVPSVAVTKEYFNIKHGIKLTRKNLYLRDNFTCAFCDDVFDTQDLSIDHVIPKSRGGKNEWTNLVTACNPCNWDKGDKIIKPLRMPYKPDYYSMLDTIDLSNLEIKDPRWIDYLPMQKKAA
jgi:5-methylcytosine-specific restriction endonuclease McrA